MLFRAVPSGGVAQRGGVWRGACRARASQGPSGTRSLITLRSCDRDPLPFQRVGSSSSTAPLLAGRGVVWTTLCDYLDARPGRRVRPRRPRAPSPPPAPRHGPLYLASPGAGAAGASAGARRGAGQPTGRPTPERCAPATPRDGRPHHLVSVAGLSALHPPSAWNFTRPFIIGLASVRLARLGPPTDTRGKSCRSVSHPAAPRRATPRRATHTFITFLSGGPQGRGCQTDMPPRGHMRPRARAEAFRPPSPPKPRTRGAQGQVGLSKASARWRPTRCRAAASTR